MIRTDVRIERLTGDAVNAAIDELARLRILVFRDFPYLYDGSLEYEHRYLATYAGCEGAVIVGAFDGDHLVGASTGLPARFEEPYITEALIRAGLDINSVFYFAESVLEEEWRGQGIGVRFFEEREEHARQLPGIRHLVFCAVIRPDDHPRRPADFAALTDFWHKRGFRPMPGVTCEFSWQDLDEEGESPKQMQFWIKDLEDRAG